MNTRYAYNTLGQLDWQETPDGGEANMYYDGLGRIRISQNARQQEDGYYSYTKYDGQGRIVEVGQLEGYQGGAGWKYDSESKVDRALLDNIEFPNAERFLLDQRTVTHYDDTDLLPDYHWTGDALPEFEQHNLRGRVAWRQLINSRHALLSDPRDPASTPVANAMLYDYDIHGNVRRVMQASLNARTTEYEYDLISGNVKHVAFIEPDALTNDFENPDSYAGIFLHRYRYDADNRLTDVETSSDGFVWMQEAKYRYYAHGPLARIELGELKVQGQDYYYSLQGWLKGANAPAGEDPGRDGNPDDPRMRFVSEDAFAYALGYYKEDYSPIRAENPAGKGQWDAFRKSNDRAKTGLYNGNISWMATDLKGAEGKGVQLMAYRYDQLNRIRKATAFRKTEGSGWIQANKAHSTAYQYDANGNLLWLDRYDGNGQLMDALSYHYRKDANGNPTNQLGHVFDWATDVSDRNSYDFSKRSWNGNMPDPAHSGQLSKKDFASQKEGNYQYDEIGNLISDKSEGIIDIEWTIYGKVKRVVKEDRSEVIYHYGVDGNRVLKRVRSPKLEGEKITQYFRDASGNIMQTLTQRKEAENDTLYVEKEYPIYGASRLGMYHITEKTVISTGETIREKGAERGQLFLGSRSYELANHLGNVLTTISDRKEYATGDDGKAILDEKGRIFKFIPHILSQSDYYPFGLAMESRSIRNEKYRFGFNGMEKDDNFATGSYNFGARMYNSFIGRWNARDPLESKYPHTSTYVFVANSPLMYVDPDGRDKIYFIEIWNGGGAYETVIVKQDGPDIYYSKKFKWWVGITGPWFSAKDDLYDTEEIASKNGFVAFLRFAGWGEFNSAFFIDQVNSDPVYSNWVKEQASEGKQFYVDLLIGAKIRQYTQEVDNIITIVEIVQGVGSPSKIFKYNTLRKGSALKKGVTSESLRKSVEEWSKFKATIANSNTERKFNTATVVYDKVTGKYYYGMNRGIKNANTPINEVLQGKLPTEATKLTNYPIANCAECDAVNKALNDGAKWDNLVLSTVGVSTSYDKNKKLMSIEFFTKPQCKDCQNIFKGIEDLSY